MLFRCLLLFVGICGVVAPNDFPPPQLELSSVRQVEGRAIFIEWVSILNIFTIYDDYIFNVTGNGVTEVIRVPYVLGRQSHAFRGLQPVTRYSISAVLVDVFGTLSYEAFVLNVTTAAGVECSSSPRLVIGHDDIRRINPQPGDEIVITSRDVISTADTANIDPKCKITDFEINHAEIVVNLDECEPRVKIAYDKFLPPHLQPNDTLTYTYTIRLARNASKYDAPYYRFPSTSCIELSCSFDREMSVETGLVVPYVRQISVALNPTQGEFNVQFALFQDDSFTTMVTQTPTIIQVPDYIYGQLRITVQSNNFVLQTPTCWATATADSNDPIYQMITGGCAEVHSYDPPNAIVVLQNYEGHTTQFKVKAFVWTGVPDADQNIFIHCQVNICNNDLHGNCSVKPCDSKRKRSLPEIDEKRTITYGPITMRHMTSSSEKCSERNGGCEEICGVEEGEVVCGCGIGKKLGEDGRSCLKAGIVGFKEEEELFQPSVTSLAAVAAIFVTTLLIVTIYKFANRQKKSPAIYAHM